jgi:hypothetical protein
LDRRLGEPHSRSGRCGKDKNILLLLGIEPRSCTEDEDEEEKGKKELKRNRIKIGGSKYKQHYCL